MAASYEEINYSLRPAKQIERKMICEAISRLSEFGTIETYRYIGLGSIYFSDFMLIHRKLNISEMLSIENDEHKKARFYFNRPFECINIEFGHSNKVLPTLDWDQRTVLWLDYDSRLNDGTLADICSFCANAISGSMLIVTVNAHFAASEKDRLRQFRSTIASERIPIQLEESDLAGWAAAKSFRRIMTSAIEKFLQERNGTRSKGTRLGWKQVLSFEYADGAKMTTLGGVIVDEGHEPQFNCCNFKALCFTQKTWEDSYRIDVPALTHRELRYLDQRFPRSDVDGVETYEIPQRDVVNYLRLYRYFPNFSEIDL